MEIEETTDRSVSVELTYEALDVVGHRRAPVWVWAIVVVYGLMMLVILALPAAVKIDNPDDWEALTTISLLAGGLGMSWCSLLLVPVRARQRRTISKRAIWIPLVGSGLAFGLLIAGASAALFELWKIGQLWEIIVLASAGWVAWAVVFWLIVRRRGTSGIGAWLHRWLLVGSVLELLVAVPAHVIVRRRTDCCAGMATGFGICCGVAVMIVAFGPSVLLLYWRKTREISNRG